MKVEEIIDLSLKVMLMEHRAMEHPERDRMSKKSAVKKYGGLLNKWIERGLVPEIPSENGGHTYYPKHRLEELWMMHMMGKEALI